MTEARELVDGRSLQVIPNKHLNFCARLSMLHLVPHMDSTFPVHGSFVSPEIGPPAAIWNSLESGVLT